MYKYLKILKIIKYKIDILFYRNQEKQDEGIRRKQDGGIRRKQDGGIRRKQDEGIRKKPDRGSRRNKMKESGVS